MTYAGKGVQENLIEGTISFEMKNCQNFLDGKIKVFQEQRNTCIKAKCYERSPLSALQASYHIFPLQTPLIPSKLILFTLLCSQGFLLNPSSMATSYIKTFFIPRINVNVSPLRYKRITSRQNSSMGDSDSAESFYYQEISFLFSFFFNFEFMSVHCPILPSFSFKSWMWHITSKKLSPHFYPTQILSFLDVLHFIPLNLNIKHHSQNCSSPYLASQLHSHICCVETLTKLSDIHGCSLKTECQKPISCPFFCQKVKFLLDSKDSQYSQTTLLHFLMMTCCHQLLGYSAWEIKVTMTRSSIFPTENYHLCTHSIPQFTITEILTNSLIPT